MDVEDAARETKGVSVELLSAIDLGPEVEGMAGLQFRMRMVTIEPGGVFGPLHDHKGRPGMVYVLQGTITDHRDGATGSTGRDWAGPRTRTPRTGSRTGDRRRRWRSRSTSSRNGEGRVVDSDAVQTSFGKLSRKTTPPTNAADANVSIPYCGRGFAKRVAMADENNTTANSTLRIV